MFRATSIILMIAAWVAAPALVFFLGHRFAKGEPGLAVGTELPRAELHTLSGEPVDTSSWRGQATALLLFRPACGACEREIRGLEQVASAFPGLRVELLSLDPAPPGYKAPFEVLVDPTGAFVSRARRRIVPTLYLIDASGRVRHSRMGVRLPAEDRTLLNHFLQRGNP